MCNYPVVVEPSVTWRVVPVRAPYVLRTCPRCDARREFLCSERFRVNASGRRIDVWLIYRCASCELTWNLEVVERSTPEVIGATRLRAFAENDPDTAWSCAFDATLLRRAGVRMEDWTPVVVERAALLAPSVTVRFSLPFPVRVRLDRLLAQELQVPRSRLRGHVESERELRRPVAHGQIVRLRGLDEIPAGLSGMAR